MLKNSVRKFLIRRLREYYTQVKALSTINTDSIPASTLTYLDSQNAKMEADMRTITGLLTTCSTDELKKINIVEVVNKFPEINLLEEI